MHVVTVGGREELRRHPLDLSGKNVSHPVSERLSVVALAAKPERGRQSDFGQQLVVLGDQLGQDLIAALDGDHMGKPHNPYLRVIAALLDPLDPVNMEKLGVDCPLVKAELKFFNSLLGLFSFHNFLKKTWALCPPVCHYTGI